MPDPESGNQPGRAPLRCFERCVLVSVILQNVFLLFSAVAVYQLTIQDSNAKFQMNIVNLTIFSDNLREAQNLQFVNQEAQVGSLYTINNRTHSVTMPSRGVYQIVVKLALNCSHGCPNGTLKLYAEEDKKLMECELQLKMTGACTEKIPVDSSTQMLFKMEVERARNDYNHIGNWHLDGTRSYLLIIRIGN